MESFEDFSKLLDGIQTTSKDGKSIKSAFVNFFHDFPQKLYSMHNDMKAELVDLCKCKDEKIYRLENQVKELNEKLTKLDDKIDEQEAYERRDSLIISGKKLPKVVPNENCPELVKKILAENLGLTMSPNEISVSHRLGPIPISQRPDQRKIIVKFCRRDAKMDVLAAARRVKPEDLYVNESLTPIRQNIMFALRRAKREHPNLISGTSTIEGSVYVWVKPPNPEAQGARAVRHKINSLAKLEDFCSSTLQKPAVHFLQAMRNQN